MRNVNGFRARVYFLRTEEGGRKIPVLSGYRPSLTFGSKQSGCQMKFQNKELALLGEECIARVTLLSSQFVYSELKPNAYLEVREGSKVIVKGTDLVVLQDS